MSEKRFEIKADDVDSSIINITRDGEDFAWFLSDDITDKQVEKVCDLLNEQQATIKELEEEIKLLKPTNVEQYEQIVQLQEENEQLQAQLREKEQDEQLYANEIVKLNKEAKEVLDFKNLGGDY